VFGVEGYFDQLLSGVKKDYWYPFDPNRVTELPDSAEGASLVLTLDREVQATVEKILDNAVVANGAYAGTILVMKPDTGEILAMATTPRININEYWRVGEVFHEDQVFNQAIHSYEPGSVFKVFTMAAALDSGTVDANTTFVDTGIFQIGGIPIYNWDRGAWGPQSMLGCMQHSLNVCLAWVADQMGAALFYSYLQEFGFGHPTGIELDTEVSGHLKLPGDSDWYEADLGTNAFGQGISVTPIQMVMGLSAIANDGKMVLPRIVHSVIDRERQYNTSIQIIGEPISKETANSLSEMLAVSLEEEASTALVPGYRVAGKTGTAEIPSPQGYVSSVTNASFAGWGPVDDPQFIVYIWLEKPTSSPWGSVVAAPIFREVVKRIVVLLDIPPDPVRHTLLITEDIP
jgi:cell division protein FtsI/penicillin-binding protein 2